jgi:hypothetical protein
VIVKLRTEHGEILVNTRYVIRCAQILSDPPRTLVVIDECETSSMLPGRSEHIVAGSLDEVHALLRGVDPLDAREAAEAMKLWREGAAKEG